MCYLRLKSIELYSGRNLLLGDSFIFIFYNLGSWLEGVILFFFFSLVPGHRCSLSKILTEFLGCSPIEIFPNISLKLWNLCLTRSPKQLFFTRFMELHSVLGLFIIHQRLWYPVLQIPTALIKLNSNLNLLNQDSIFWLTRYLFLLK